MNRRRSESHLAAALLAALLPAAPPAFALDGELDTEFATGGKYWDASTTFPANDWDVLDSVTAPDGRAVFAGRRDANQDGNYGHWFWHEFSSTGSAGRCLLAAPDESVQNSALAFDSQGRLLLFGVYDDDVDGETLLVARFLYPDCTLDESFGNGNGTLYPLSRASLRVNDVTLDANDRPILAGNVGSGDAAVVRLTSAGLPDSSFAGDGVLEDHLDELSSSTAAWRDVLILPGGDIVVAGSAFTAGGNGTQAVVARYSPSAQPVASFSGDGYLALSFSPTAPEVVDFATSVAWDPRTRRIYLAGGTEDGSTPKGGVAALTESGALDSGFSANGLLMAAVRSRFEAIAVDGLGRVVAAGYSETGAALDHAFYAERYTTGGAFDATFGASANGRVTADFDQVTDGVDDGRALSIVPGGIVIGGNVERSSRIVVGVARLTLSLLFADGFESGSEQAW